MLLVVLTGDVAFSSSKRDQAGEVCDAIVHVSISRYLRRTGLDMREALLKAILLRSYSSLDADLRL
jgi:hypothetical protein